MKPAAIRDLSIAEMEDKLIDLQQELFNLRFQHGIGQLENARKMTLVKRDIARIKTILREPKGKK